VRILKGKQSPWKERVAGRWQRRLVTTDSSAEQSLEVGCSVRFRRAQTSAHFGGCRRSAMGNPRFRLRAPGGSLRAVDRDLSSATRGGKPAPVGGSIASGGVSASALASSGQFHATTPEASASDCVVCSMTWGSASADRSIIASTPLPRTPVTPPERAGTLGHPGQGTRRFFKHRALGPRYQVSGALRSIARPVPSGTSSDLLGGPGGVPSGYGRRSSSEPREPTSLESGDQHPSGRWKAHSTGTGNSELFGAPVSPIPPGQGTRTSSEGRYPVSTPASSPQPRGRSPDHLGAAERSSSEHRPAHLAGAGQPELFGASVGQF
jgi:hypothetical protein